MRAGSGYRPGRRTATVSRLGTVLFAFALVAGACSSNSSTDAAGETADAGTDGDSIGGNTAVESGDAATTAADDADDDGASDDRASDDGASDDGASDDGASDDGASDDGDAAEAEGAVDDDAPVTDGAAIDAELAAALEPVEEGDSGEAVEALQQRLDDLGLAPGVVDGDYGGRTVASIEAFQELVGLAPTGTADQATLDELLTYRYDGVVLRAGDEGRDVEALQERLAAGPFDPGVIDGEYGGRTIQAVWALEKLAGIPVDGDWGPLDELAWEQLEDGRIGRPVMDNELRWVEVDLSEQLVKIYEPGATTPYLISHASSGSGIPWQNEEHSGSSVTPRGDFHIDRRIDGWRESSLGIGRLYKPLYFRGGIALHGSQSVPLYPASHGCIRLPMHIADYLPDELPNGTPVHVLD